jgi:hypothetical protein
MNKINLLKDKYQLNNIFYKYLLKIDTKKLIELINDIESFLKTNIIDTKLANINQYYSLFIGLYYQFIPKPKNCYFIHKYYDTSFKLGNINAMVYLGRHYFYELKDDSMIKCYLIAIEKGNTTAMRLLGLYYEKAVKDYDLMLKYYLMAIDKGKTSAMHCLASYYRFTDKNYELMKKYYLMAIDKGHANSVCALAVFYIIFEKNYFLGKKYCLLGNKYCSLSKKKNIIYNDLTHVLYINIYKYGFNLL